jgi:hypothetical protein
MPPPYLFPEETGKTKHAPTAIMRTEQTKKHCDNQEDVGGEYRDDDKFVALHVGRQASLNYR